MSLTRRESFDALGVCGILLLARLEQARRLIRELSGDDKSAEIRRVNEEVVSVFGQESLEPSNQVELSWN